MSGTASTMKYASVSFGTAEAVFNKLGGLEGIEAFLRGETEVVRVEPPGFKVWKTITLGIGPKTVADFRKALKKSGCNIGTWGNDILGQPAFTVAPEKTEVDLVNVSVAELGFKDGATREKIYKRAMELGLKLCPAEVGPQLRLQYLDQPQGEWLLIGMEPITGSGGDPRVFVVEHDVVERWLGGNVGDPARVWFSAHRWVFLRRK
ncbi:MAG: hypothetical protein U9M92_02845 [Patescibacteria group bacterium]|nr:hypothetical protein [Patescibacteria group bacterium]